MSATEPRAPLDQLAGLVERVTFHNEETGFCVLRLNVRGERDLITLVGHAPSVTPGEYATASGNWVTTASTAARMVAGRSIVNLGRPLTRVASKVGVESGRQRCD